MLWVRTWLVRIFRSGSLPFGLSSLLYFGRWLFAICLYEHTDCFSGSRFQSPTLWRVSLSLVGAGDKTKDVEARSRHLEFPNTKLHVFCESAKSTKNIIPILLVVLSPCKTSRTELPDNVWWKHRLPYDFVKIPSDPSRLSLQKYICLPHENIAPKVGIGMWWEGLLQLEI